MVNLLTLSNSSKASLNSAFLSRSSSVSLILECPCPVIPASSPLPIPSFSNLYGVLFRKSPGHTPQPTSKGVELKTDLGPSLLNHLLSRWRQFSDPTVTLFQLTFPPWSSPEALSKHNPLSLEVIILQPWVYQIENIPDFQKDSRLILKIWDKLEIFQRFLKHLIVLIHMVGLVMLRYECFPLWDTDKAIKNLSSWHIWWNVKRHTKRTPRDQQSFPFE